MNTPRSLTDAEFETYLEHWKARFPKTYLAPILWGFCGLRLLEIRSLKWADVLTDNQPATAITIAKNTNHQGKSRALPLPANVRLEIQHHLARCDYVDGIPDPAALYLIPGDKREIISERTLEWQASQIGKSSCARTVTPHMLRHTFANRLLPASNLRIVQSALGHRSIKSTIRYLHPTFHDLARAMERSSNLPPQPTPPTNPPPSTTEP